MPGVADAIQFVLFLVVLFTALLGSTRFENRYAPKFDTQIRVLVVYFLLSLFLILTTIAGVALSSYAEEANTVMSEISRRILSWVFLSPIALALVAYALVRGVIIKAYKAKLVGEGENLSETSRQILEHCELMGIEKPTVLVSGIPFLPPQVLGTFRNAYVILPRNYKDILDSVERKVGVDARNTLNEFVLRHELAHLANKDYRLFTWLGTYLRILVMSWFPVYLASTLVMFFANRPSELLGILHASIVLPLLNAGLLYALTLSIMRDRELIADHASANELTESSRSSIAERTVHVDDENVSPLQLLTRMFSVRVSPMLGVSFSNAKGSDPPAGVRNALSKLSQLVSRLLGLFMETHPTDELRIRSLTSKSDPLLLRQGEKENGMFVGLGLGLLLSYWGFSLRIFSPEPSNDGFFMIGLIMSGIVAASIFLPARHVDSSKVLFEQYDRTVQIKILYTSLGLISFVVLIGLPVLGFGQFLFLLRVSLFVAAGGYAFYLMVFMAAVTFGRLNFPQTRTLWRVGIRLIVALFIMALLFG